jgi:O-antigen ligase
MRARSSGVLGWLLAALVLTLALGAQGALATVGGLQIRPYLPLLLAAAVVIMVRARRRGVLPPAPARSSVFALGLMLFAGLLSIFNAEYAAQALKQTVFLLGMIGIYLVLLFAELSERELRRITQAILWSLAAALAFGFLTFALEYARSGAVVVAFVGFRSFFEERNEFGLFMVYAAGFLIPLALNDDQPVRHKILLLLTVIALLLNFSRGSLVAFAAMVVVDRLGAGRLFAPRRVRRSLLTLGVITIAAGAGVLRLTGLSGMPEFLEVLTTRSLGFRFTTDETTSVRLLFIRTASEAFRAHPFIGNGIGNVGYALNQYGRSADFGTVTLRGAVQPPVYDLGTTSNIFADMLLETGLFGLLAFVAFLVIVLRASLREGTGRNNSGLLQSGALLSFIGVLINGLSYNSLYLPFTWVAFALAPLVAASTAPRETPVTEPLPAETVS